MELTKSSVALVNLDDRFRHYTIITSANYIFQRSQQPTDTLVFDNFQFVAYQRKL